MIKQLSNTARNNHLILNTFFVFLVFLKLLVLLVTDFNAKPAIEVVRLQHMSLSNLDFQEIIENFTFSVYSVVTYPLYFFMESSIFATRVFNIFVNFLILVILSKYINRIHSARYLLLISLYPALSYYSVYELRDVFLSFLILIFVLRFASARTYRDALIFLFFGILITITRPELNIGLIITIMAIILTYRQINIKLRLLLFSLSLFLASVLFFEVSSTLSELSFLDYYQARAKIQYINNGSGSSVLNYKDIIENGFTLSVIFKGMFFLYFPFFNPNLELGKKLFYSVDSLFFIYIFIKSLTVKIDREYVNRFRVVRLYLLSNVFIFSFFISNYMNFLRVKIPLVVGLIALLLYFSKKYK